jgi:hypothetical protein
MNKNEKSKFIFDEIVVIKTKDSNTLHLNNQKGYISGKSCNEKGEWNYGVFIFDLEEVWCFDEHELEKTGKHVSEDYNKTGETVKIIVDENGEGKIKDD